MAYNVYFEDVTIGDELPAWSRKTDFMNWNRYAAVNDEFVYIHMDDEAGRAALNEQGAFGMGNLRYAYIVNALQDWIGDEATIREIGCHRCRMAVGNVDPVPTRLDIDVVNHNGEPTCPGKAVVVIPSRA